MIRGDWVNRFRYLFKDERGNVLVIFAVALIALLGFAAIVIDVGGMYVERRSMVTAADAGALAGARELAESGDEALAEQAAALFAQTNGAEITDDIEVLDVEYNGESFKAVRASVGVNREHFFAKALGFNDSDVFARAVATWGYPKALSNLLPIFFEIEDGQSLPEGEQLLLDESLEPGNWGFLALNPSGQNAINAVLAGGVNDYEYEVGDEITQDTKPGNANSRINPIEERMRLAADPDSGVSMVGILPIIREITSGGRTEVVIVGFAPFLIKDVITAKTKEEDNLWYGRGSVYAHLENPPNYYGGYPMPQDIDEEFPKGAIIGEFLDQYFIPASQVGEITQNPEFGFGTHVIRLVE
ncbi:hypothetical protein DealDRAFT_0813 [Dethiobacter alkaliphilus AHT 1]|uniref:Putative Flp pilus-assembly TadG-like N-terminal domain-containing protein n=1 Tax=Dethiobacter alkaliphilus AHT 1 TaxID=555088 RepID=C0GEA4_DETAL|nr:hypothetical protein DealDRAFT_0813 [Dethiobacter alkaliphilus AHT 1]